MSFLSVFVFNEKNRRVLFFQIRIDLEKNLTEEIWQNMHYKLYRVKKIEITSNQIEHNTHLYKILFSYKVFRMKYEV